MTLCEFIDLLDRETCAEMEVLGHYDELGQTVRLAVGYDARYATRRVTQVFPIVNPRNLVHPRLCVILEKDE